MTSPAVDPLQLALRHVDEPLRVVATFPRPVRLLLFGTLVNKLGTFILRDPAFVLLRDSHLAEGDAAALLSAYGGGSLVSILVGGVLTEWLGRRRTLLLSLFGSGLLAVAMGLLPSARTPSSRCSSPSPRPTRGPPARPGVPAGGGRRLHLLADLLLQPSRRTVRSLCHCTRRSASARSGA